MSAKILIIDDTKNIRLLTTKALSAEGYEVDSADSGAEGIKYFCNNKYDLVMLDIRMPNLSGTEVLKKLKEIDEKIPVIIITAFPTVKNAVDCIKLGAIDYLRKPFTAEKIKQIVNTIIERKELTVDMVDSYETYIEYAKKCINEKNFEETVEYLRKAIAVNIETAEPFNILGSIFELKEEYETALKYYNIALQFEPDSEAVADNIKRIKEVRSRL
jgi:DNA-binding NtrC family response regulator